MIQVRLFAALRERAGRDSMEVNLPDGVTTVSELVSWLEQSDPDLAKAFAATPCRMVAVNEVLASEDADIGDGDVIALFPPVTGG
ncbi:MAG: molybdopterin converting factor subunit 1 [Alcanivorax sediminis]|uniref:Molybdopterin synthase sulfur carrier subunit n=1 Tax=Alcanivorax sediminis TaxID=2663008 RepID=A0A6N7LXI4_9GAMM|nr:molybdopterin converting factor subunit 1 [Alcanivorax sediminis]MQX53894.1 molybdopterin converting factor subunit 1 [Alcanivorax sediminis]